MSTVIAPATAPSTAAATTTVKAYLRPIDRDGLMAFAEKGRNNPASRGTNKVHTVMEGQYRYPVRQTMIEFPAGKLDAGEGGLACAQRELLEETGYRARRWAKAGVMHPVIGYATEVIEVWFADELSLGDRQLDEGEFLDVFTATQQELEDWMRDGLLTDAKTVVGMMWLLQWRAGRWPLQWQTV